MGRTAKKPAEINMTILTATGVTAVNDSVCASVTDLLTDGKSVVYASASMRYATIFNKFGKAFGDYDESSCNLGSLLVTHLDDGFSVAELTDKYADADVLIIDDMTAADGYPYSLPYDLKTLKKYASGKRVFVGVIQSRQKASSAKLVQFAKKFAEQNGIKYEEIKRDTPEDAPETPAEPKPAPQGEENKGGENKEEGGQ